jgi:hypothetical protein
MRTRISFSRELSCQEGLLLWYPGSLDGQVIDSDSRENPVRDGSVSQFAKFEKIYFFQVRFIKGESPSCQVGRISLSRISNVTCHEFNS